jgi:hypothetical protein
VAWRGEQQSIEAGAGVLAQRRDELGPLGSYSACALIFIIFTWQYLKVTAIVYGDNDREERRKKMKAERNIFQEQPLIEVFDAVC